MGGWLQPALYELCEGQHICLGSSLQLAVQVEAAAHQLADEVTGYC
jgi:hypothetical protein